MATDFFKDWPKLGGEVFSRHTLCGTTDLTVAADRWLNVVICSIGTETSHSLKIPSAFARELAKELLAAADAADSGADQVFGGKS